MTVFLDKLSERDVDVELVWVWVFPTDLQLVDCLAADFEVLLLKTKNKRAFEKLNMVSPEACLTEFCILPQRGPNTVRFL